MAADGRTICTWNGNTLAISIENQAVIHAAQAAIFNPPKRKRCVTMGAPVSERSNCAVRTTEKHHWQIDDLATEGLVRGKLVLPCGHVPTVPDKHLDALRDWVLQMARP